MFGSLLIYARKTIKVQFSLPTQNKVMQSQRNVLLTWKCNHSLTHPIGNYYLTWDTDLYSLFLKHDCGMGRSH